MAYRETHVQQTLLVARALCWQRGTRVCNPSEASYWDFIVHCVSFRMPCLGISVGSEAKCQFFMTALLRIFLPRKCQSVIILQYFLCFGVTPTSLYPQWLSVVATCVIIWHSFKSVMEFSVQVHQPLSAGTLILWFHSGQLSFDLFSSCLHFNKHIISSPARKQRISCVTSLNHFWTIQEQ